MRESGIERRTHPRIETNVSAHGSTDGGGVVARMVTDNLSLAGLQCTSNADFPEMTRLAVRLMLPGASNTPDREDAIDVEAVVVRRADLERSSAGEARYQLALFFTSMDDSAKQRLANYLDSK